jgi:hypothetical protein
MTRLATLKNAPRRVGNLVCRQLFQLWVEIPSIEKAVDRTPPRDAIAEQAVVGETLESRMPNPHVGQK